MRNYFRLIIGLLLMMGGCGFTSDYFNDSKREELDAQISDMVKLIASPKETAAVLDSTYTITTIKIMGAPVKFYETKYFFSIDNQSYTGIYKPKEPPTIPIIKIQYLQENPAINSANPKSDLSSLQSSRSSNAFLYIGLFLLAMGAFTVYTNIKQIRQRKKQEEEESEKRIAEFNRSKGLL